MKAIRVLVPVMIGCAALVLIGCAKPPKAELDAANAAFTDAQKAEAEQYAPAEWGAAKKLIDEMNGRVQMKKYDTAKDFAILAKGKAEAAKKQAEEAKEAQKKDAQLAVEGVQKRAENLKNFISALETTAGFPAAQLTPFKNQLPAIEARVAEIETLNKDGKFREAVALGFPLLDQFSGWEKEISDMLTKYDEAKKAAEKPAGKKTTKK